MGLRTDPSILIGTLAAVFSHPAPSTLEPRWR
jgi:hypothetical protein